MPYRVDHAPSAALFGGRRIVACSRCGLLQIDPLPTADELAGYYRDTYRSDGAFAKVDEDRFPFDSAWFLSRGRAVRAFAAAAGWRAPPGRPPRILDVGAGFGHVLYAFGEIAPAELYATEADPACAPYLERIGARRLAHGADGLPLAGDGYDLIIMTHVLEHLRGPARSLAALGGMLAAGGRIVIEIPNCQPEFAAQWAYVPHVSFFDQPSLVRLVAEARGRVLASSVCGPPWERPTWRRFVPAPVKRIARRVVARRDATTAPAEAWRRSDYIPLPDFAREGPDRQFLRALLAFD